MAAAAAAAAAGASPPPCPAEGAQAAKPALSCPSKGLCPGGAEGGARGRKHYSNHDSRQRAKSDRLLCRGRSY